MTVNSTRILCTISAFVAILFCGCMQHENRTNQSEAASALYANYETVFYSKANLLGVSSVPHQLSEEERRIAGMPFADLLGGLGALGAQVPTETLNNADAVLIGAKDFRPPSGPTGLGDVQSQFCYVLVLPERTAFAIGEIIGKSPLATQVESSIWKWSVRGTEGHPEPMPFYAAQVGRSFVVVGNTVDAVKEMTTILATNNNASGNVISTRDWEEISAHDMWGYRRYIDSADNTVDKIAAGTEDVMSGTTALAFFLDFEQRTGVLRLFSSTSETADKMNVRPGLPLFRPAGNGMWEARILLYGNADAGQQTFIVMGLFGFGVYL